MWGGALKRAEVAGLRAGTDTAASPAARVVSMGEAAKVVSIETCAAWAGRVLLIIRPRKSGANSRRERQRVKNDT